MKKPEPCDIANRGARGVCWPFGRVPSGISPKPKRLKKRSIDEPGGNGELSSPKAIASGPRSLLTRTANTAGFTFSTISAKLAGRIAVWAYAAEIVGTLELVGSCAPANSREPPTAATEPRRTRRRTERTLRGLAGEAAFSDMAFLFICKLG